jgi:hypothetical protein
LVDALDQPGKRVPVGLENNILLKDVVEVYVKATVPIEDRDEPAAIFVQPKVGICGMDNGLHSHLNHPYARSP